MRLYVSGATAVMRRLISEGYGDVLGVLAVPAAGNSPLTVREFDVPAAADNGAYTGFNAKKFMGMVADYAEAGIELEWVTAPDVVYDAAATFAGYEKWRKRIEAFGFPAALVLQNGMTVESVSAVDPPAVFVGGDDAFKLGPDARAIVEWAAGRPAHMGRVNTPRRMQYAAEIGCTSIDGRKWQAWSETYLPRGVKIMRRINQRLGCRGLFAVTD